MATNNSTAPKERAPLIVKQRIRDEVEPVLTDAQRAQLARHRRSRTRRVRAS